MPAKAETPATGAAVSRLLALLAQRPHQRTLVALAGLPGSGKSTAAAQWTLAVNAQCGPGTMVALGMDGFHLSRAQLASLPDPAAALRRRGAPWTFDPQALSQRLQALRPETGQPAESLGWPGFEHDVGDPVADAITVPPQARLILVEGLYLLHQDHGWNTADLFDQRWFLDVPLPLAMQRLTLRHMQSAGLSRDQALARIASNDRLNAELVEASRGRADFLVGA
jgi:pantothenate kinase